MSTLLYECTPVLHEHAGEGGVEQRRQHGGREDQARAVPQAAPGQQEGVVRDVRVRAHLRSQNRLATMLQPYSLCVVLVMRKPQMSGKTCNLPVISL